MVTIIEVTGLVVKGLVVNVVEIVEVTAGVP